MGGGALRYVSALVSKAVTHASDSASARGEKVRLLLLSAAMLVLLTTVAITVAASPPPGTGRDYLVAFLGLCVLVLLLAIAMQCVSKLLLAPLLVTSTSVLAALLWCAAALGGTRQGAVALGAALCTSALPCAVLPSNAWSPRLTAGLALLAVAGVAAVVGISESGAVAAHPLDPIEFGILLACITLGFLLLVASLCSQQLQLACEQRRIWGSQRRLEERLAFALDLVRQPLTDIQAAAEGEYPPHPTVTVAAQLLQHAVDDVQSVVGFHVSYVNHRPFVLRQAIAFAVSEMAAFTRSRSRRGAPQRGDRTERRGAEGGDPPGLNFCVAIDSEVPTTVVADGRRVVEVLIEVLFSASRRAVFDVFVRAQLREGAVLVVRVGDDGRLWDEAHKARLLAPGGRNEVPGWDAVGLPRCRRLLRLMGGELTLAQIRGRRIGVPDFAADPAAEYNTIELSLPLTAPPLPASVAAADEGAVHATDPGAFFGPRGAAGAAPRGSGKSAAAATAAELLSKHFPGALDVAAVDVNEAHRLRRLALREQEQRRRARCNHRILTSRVDPAVDDDDDRDGSEDHDVAAGARNSSSNTNTNTNNNSNPLAFATPPPSAEQPPLAPLEAPLISQPSASAHDARRSAPAEGDGSGMDAGPQWWPPPGRCHAPQESPIHRLNASTASLLVRPEEWAHL